MSNSATFGRADLLELVDAAQDARGVREADPGVEALGQLAVVDPQQEIGDGQRVQRLGDHQRDFDVVPERQFAVADNVDVRLGELAGPALLRTLAAPDLLDLVAAEREGEVAGVFHDVPGEGHGEVEVQGEGVRVGLGRGVLLVLEPAEPVDLFVDLALAQQLADRFHGAGLDRGETMEFEGPAQRVQHMEFHQPLLGKPLGES